MSSPTTAPTEHAPKLTKATPVSLREAGITESWLESEIEKDPAMLRLGDVTVIERQRRQEKAGRLDLLLEDDSGEERYEVELMLGTTDESHLIRTVEYWDIERRKWPRYEHCAVLIAEDVAARFLNVISLFSGTVPFVVILGIPVKPISIPIDRDQCSGLDPISGRSEATLAVALCGK